MPVNLASIYHNPVIPPAYYYAKVVEIETDPIDRFCRPLILVGVRIHPDHGVGDDVILTNIIHPTEQSQLYYDTFIRTFSIVDEGNLGVIRNRWASIQVYDAQYKKTKYSALRWVYQPRHIRFECFQMEQAERRNRRPCLPEGAFRPQT